MPAPRKLSDQQVKLIRRRVLRGERLTDLAAQFGVDRRTIRRRLDSLEQAEVAEARRKAANRLRRQAKAERRKLEEREPVPAAPAPLVSSRRLSRYGEWLRTPKSLSGRALAEASGLVRVRSPDGAILFAEPLVELPALSGRELDAERWDQDGDHCAPRMRRGPFVPG